MSEDRQEPPAGDGADDRDQRIPPDGRTAGREPVGPTTPPAPEPSGPAPWSGRAEVPPSRPAGFQEPVGGEWYGEAQGDRRWWMPILVGILALLLLGLLGLGLWLILQADDGPGKAPSPPATSAPATTGVPTTSPTTPSTTTPPTTPSLTTSPTTMPPTTTAPARITMPLLVGRPQAAARAVLDRLGLGYRLELRESDQPAGTVIATDPSAGEPVSVGQDVTLVIAEPGAAATSILPSPEVTATG